MEELCHPLGYPLSATLASLPTGAVSFGISLPNLRILCSIPATKASKWTEANVGLVCLKMGLLPPQ
jgi:hypothetical protein